MGSFLIKSDSLLVKPGTYNDSNYGIIAIKQSRACDWRLSKYQSIHWSRSFWEFCERAFAQLVWAGRLLESGQKPMRRNADLMTPFAGQLMRFKGRFQRCQKWHHWARFSDAQLADLEIGAFSDADLVPKRMKKRAFGQLMYPVHVFNSLKVRNQKKKRHLRRIRWPTCIARSLGTTGIDYREWGVTCRTVLWWGCLGVFRSSLRVRKQTGTEGS